MLWEQRVRLAGLTTVAALLVLLASFGGATAPAASAAEGAFPACESFTDFDSNNFSDPTAIDNEWFPLIPGTQLILEGEADRGGGLGAARVVFTVTDLTKVINGVRTMVVWDRDFSEGELAEEELAFFAQDDDGNVWALGEYPEEHEDGEFIGAADTWIAGVADAQAGIAMRAEPERGTTWYVQGWSPDIEFLDCARVFKIGQTASVPLDSFENVLITRERSPLAREGGTQLKYYASGVGNVQVGAVGDREAETLQLVSIVALDADALAEVHERALALDMRACHNSDVYCGTPPAE